MNEGSQTNLATCDLFSYSLFQACPSLKLLLYCWSHFWMSEDRPQLCSKQLSFFLFCLKKK